MTLFRTVVGIDPSGRRLALSAVRYGVGGTFPVVPPAVVELHGDREQTRMEEAEGALRDFAGRHGLAGSEARLCVPADRVFTARLAFPPMREKDMRPALALELDRLFPLPSTRLRFVWRRSGNAAGGKETGVIVAASPTEYLARWEELVARAGLVLAGAVPSAWALGAACRGIAADAAAAELCAVLRGVDGVAECTALAAGEPFFSSMRSGPPGSAPAEALALLAEALVNVPPARAEKGVAVVAPSAWYREQGPRIPGGPPLRPVDGFETRAAAALGPPEGAGRPAATWNALGAYGAALCERGPNLLAPEEEGAGFRWIVRGAAYALAVVAVLAALSWPAAVALRTKRQLARLDAEVVALQPAVARAEESLSMLAGIDERIAVLHEASDGRGEPLRILQELTNRLPQGTWLTGLRVEDRKVELDGLSPSASEIFPPLSRDGRFRKVEFASPITRQPDNMERFQIRAEFVSGEGGEGKP